MSKQISIVGAANGWIVQVIDPALMVTGNPMTNLVARNVDEALYIVREALTGTGERQPVPAIFHEAGFLEEAAEKGAVGPAIGTPLTFSTLLNGMRLLNGLSAIGAEEGEPCTCENCQEDEGE